MTERNLSIQSVKIVRLKKDQPPKLEISLRETFADKTHADGPLTYDRPPHKELLSALSGLRVHLAILSDYISEKRAKDEDELSKFNVNGYSLGGKEDQEGVVIKGNRAGKHGSITLNSPFIRMDESSDKAYILLGDLTSKIERIEEEVIKYLEAPAVQQSLDFKEEDKSTSKNNLRRVAQSAQAPSGQAAAV